MRTDKACVRDDILDFSGLVNALAHLVALCWIMAVMVSLRVSMSWPFCMIVKHSVRLLTSPILVASHTNLVSLRSHICSSFSRYDVVCRYLQSTYRLSAAVFDPEIIST